jgi:hypothetical protein
VTGVTYYVISTQASGSVGGPTGGGGGGPTVVEAQVFFDVTPVQITKYAKPGENTTLFSELPRTNYTFRVRNSGDSQLSIVAVPQGDYADWIIAPDTAVVVQPGQDADVVLRLQVPLAATFKDYVIPVIIEDEITGGKRSVEIIVKVFGEFGDLPVYLYNKLYYPAVRFEPLADGEGTLFMERELPFRWTGDYLYIGAPETFEAPFVLKISFFLAGLYVLSKAIVRYKRKFKYKWIPEIVTVGVPLILLFVW